MLKHPNMDHHQLERATDSTLAKAVARFGTPLLVAALGTLLWMQLGDIKETQKVAADYQAITRDDISVLRSDVRVINTRLDIQVINRIGELEKKVQELERAQRVK